MNPPRKLNNIIDKASTKSDKDKWGTVASTLHFKGRQPDFHWGPFEALFPTVSRETFRVRSWIIPQLDDISPLVHCQTQETEMSDILEFLNVWTPRFFQDLENWAAIKKLRSQLSRSTLSSLASAITLPNCFFSGTLTSRDLKISIKNQKDPKRQKLSFVNFAENNARKWIE